MRPFRTEKGGRFLISVINVTAEFTSAIFLGVILLSILLQKEMRDIKTKLFFAAAAATLAGSVIDALSFILEAYPVPTALLWTVNVCALVFCDINTVPFIYYAWHIISEKKMRNILSFPSTSPHFESLQETSLLSSYQQNTKSLHHNDKQIGREGLPLSQTPSISKELCGRTIY